MTKPVPHSAAPAEVIRYAAPVADTSAPTDEPVVLRAYRFCLDPTPEQEHLFAGSAGAARWAFNHALAVKVAAHEEWREQVAKLVADGMPEADARQAVKVPIPRKQDIAKAWNATKGDDRTGVDGITPWFHRYSTYAFQSAFIDADNAWKSWIESFQGRRAGRRVGYPRFKKKGRCRDSFRIHHDVTRPTIRPGHNKIESYRWLVIPRAGAVRLHESTKRLVRELDRGGVVQSVTVSRGAHRWYASVLVKTGRRPVAHNPAPRRPDRIGVSIGVRELATLSDGTTVANPRHLARDLDRLAKAQRALAKTQKDSQRRVRAARRVGRIHHLVAERRATTLHHLTKQLSTGYAEVALHDLDIQHMTRSGRRRKPRKPHAAVAPINRAVLDVAPGEIRRQLEYKTDWYGSKVLLAPRNCPTSTTCSNCGAVRTKLTPSQRVFDCGSCGTRMPRAVNSARLIAQFAVPASGDDAPQGSAVASDRGDTLNARGGPVRPATPRGSRRGSTKREGPRGHPR